MAESRTHISRRPSVRPHLLHLGISVGTFRTSVASSNGTREHFASVVGWPRSDSTRRLLGRDVLFGNAACRNRLALDLVRPFEAGSFPSQGSAQIGSVFRKALAEILRQCVKLSLPVPGEKTRAVIAVPLRALEGGRDAILEAGKEVFDECDVVPEAWATARGAEAPAGSVLVDIGASAATIWRVGEAPPAAKDVTSLDEGGDSLDLRILELLKAHHPTGEFSVSLVRELKEKFGCLLDGDAVAGLPIAGKVETVDVFAEVAVASRESAAAVLAVVSSMLGKTPAERTVVLAGGGSQLKGLDRLIEDGLQKYGGAKIVKVAEPVFVGAFGALRLASADKS